MADWQWSAGPVPHARLMNPLTDAGFLDRRAAIQVQPEIKEALRHATWAAYNSVALRQLEQLLTGTPGSLAPVTQPTDAEHVANAIGQFQEAVNEHLFPITTDWYVEIGADFPAAPLIWLVPDVHGVEYDATFTADENGAFAEPGIIDCLMALAAAEMGYVVSNELPDGIIHDSTMPFSLLCAFYPDISQPPTGFTLSAILKTLQQIPLEPPYDCLPQAVQMVLKATDNAYLDWSHSDIIMNNVEVTWADEGVFLAEEWQAAQSWLAASATLVQAQGTTDRDRRAFCRRCAGVLYRAWYISQGQLAMAL
ncbi:MAG: hypothetical protein M9930_07100 [Anaerolineae bacterium]|nr:hypothetical protein [Anaerolineae bacterium]